MADRQARRVVAGRTVGELSCLEHGFDTWELGRMSTHTVNTTTTAIMSTTTSGAQAAADPAAPETRPDQRGAAGETATTRLRNRRAAHPCPHPPGRPATQIHATLRGSLAPLGVRLTPATLRELAADIAAGRPVELP